MRLGSTRLRRARRDHHLGSDACGSAGERQGAQFEIKPEDAGLSVAKPEQLRGGDADTNARALLGVLKGEKGPFRDIAILNAAAALIVAGRAKDLKEGAALAAKSISLGEAEGRLNRLVAASNAQ